MEFNMKDQMIRNTIMETQEDVKEIKESIEKIEDLMQNLVGVKKELTLNIKRGSSLRVREFLFFWTKTLLRNMTCLLSMTLMNLICKSKKYLVGWRRGFGCCMLFLAQEVACLQLLRGITLGLTPGLPGNLASAIVNEVMGMAAA